MAAKLLFACLLLAAVVAVHARVGDAPKGGPPSPRRQQRSVQSSQSSVVPQSKGIGPSPVPVVVDSKKVDACNALRRMAEPLGALYAVGEPPSVDSPQYRGELALQPTENVLVKTISRFEKSKSFMTTAAKTIIQRMISAITLLPGITGASPMTKGDFFVEDSTPDNFKNPCFGMPIFENSESSFMSKTRDQIVDDILRDGTPRELFCILQAASHLHHNGRKWWKLLNKPSSADRLRGLTSRDEICGTLDCDWAKSVNAEMGMWPVADGLDNFFMQLHKVVLQRDRNVMKDDCKKNAIPLFTLEAIDAVPEGIPLNDREKTEMAALWAHSVNKDLNVPSIGGRPAAEVALPFSPGPCVAKMLNTDYLRHVRATKLSYATMVSGSTSLIMYLSKVFAPQDATERKKTLEGIRMLCLYMFMMGYGHSYHEVMAGASDVLENSYGGGDGPVPWYARSFEELITDEGLRREFNELLRAQAGGCLPSDYFKDRARDCTLHTMPRRVVPQSFASDKTTKTDVSVEGDLFYQVVDDKWTVIGGGPPPKSPRSQRGSRGSQQLPSRSPQLSRSNSISQMTLRRSGSKGEMKFKEIFPLSRMRFLRSDMSARAPRISSTAFTELVENACK